MCEATTPGVQVAALNLESPLNASEIQSVGGPTWALHGNVFAQMQQRANKSLKR